MWNHPCSDEDAQDPETASTKRHRDGCSISMETQVPRKECMWIRRSLLSTSVRRHRNPSLDWPQRHNEELGRNPGVHCLWTSRFNSARWDGHHSTRFTGIRITPFPACMAFFVEMSFKNLYPKYNSFFLSFVSLFFSPFFAVSHTL